MNNKKEDLPQEVRDYMAKLGRKGGNTNKQRGSEYFKGIREGKKWADIQKEQANS
jgi:hypothetical protein